MFRRLPISPNALPNVDPSKLDRSGGGAGKPGGGKSNRGGTSCRSLTLAFGEMSTRGEVKSSEDAGEGSLWRVVDVDVEVLKWEWELPAGGKTNTFGKEGCVSGGVSGSFTANARKPTARQVSQERRAKRARHQTRIPRSNSRGRVLTLLLPALSPPLFQVVSPLWLTESFFLCPLDRRSWVEDRLADRLESWSVERCASNSVEIGRVVEEVVGRLLQDWSAGDEFFVGTGIRGWEVEESDQQHPRAPHVDLLNLCLCHNSRFLGYYIRFQCFSLRHILNSFDVNPRFFPLSPFSSMLTYVFAF